LRFKNFQIWRGRLPHWRADGVTYYVTFRHRRALTESERKTLFDLLGKFEGRKLELLILAVLSEQTDLIFRAPDGIEFSKLIETAKRKAGQKIIKLTAERYPPFWEESYDRIIRDEAEFEERWLSILESPVREELTEDPEEYPTLWVAERP
jgi:hypothetical protein